MIQAQEYPQMHDVCECGHPHNAHKGLGLKLKETDPATTRVHVCRPVTREVCDCREFRDKQ